MWRKNRNPGTKCIGVDLNRNYDSHWAEVGASLNECDDTYAGKKAFSELKSSNMKNYVLGKNVQLYLTFHSYGQYFLYPWRYTEDLPANSDELNTLANSVVAAMSTTYTIGSSANVLYLAAGGSDDWMKATAKVTLSYTIELPKDRFILPASDIKLIVEDTWKGIKVFCKHIQKKFSPKLLRNYL